MLPFTISVISINGHFFLCKNLQKYDILLLLHEMKNVIEVLIAFFLAEKERKKKSASGFNNIIRELYSQHI